MLKPLNQEDFSMQIVEDLGRQFPKETSKQKKRYAIFMCKCGIEFRASTTKVKSAHTTSCGCYQKQKASETHKRHGLRHHPLNGVWRDIKQRCYNDNRTCHIRYGGKGVTMCDEWLNDFQKFYDWSMANGYKKGLQIDKDIICTLANIEPKVYSPDTCMWLTSKDNHPENVKKFIYIVKRLEKIKEQFVHQMK